MAALQDRNTNPIYDIEIPTSYRDGLQMNRLAKRATILNRMITIGNIITLTKIRRRKKRRVYQLPQFNLWMSIEEDTDIQTYKVGVKKKILLHVDLTKEGMDVHTFVRGIWESRLSSLERELTKCQKESETPEMIPLQA